MEDINHNKKVNIERLTSARIPTRDGEFQLVLYSNNLDEKDHLALIYGDISSASDVLVRIHSECFTGDVLGSLRCDCGEQLNASMRMIAERGAGVLLYLRQEGRGIGLLNKLRAYNLQDEGYDTVEANLALGHGADERDYTIGALMLRDLDIGSVQLLTNNPEKIESLEALGIQVRERIPLQPHLNKHNSEYLQTKVERMQHMLRLGPKGVRTNPHGWALDALKQRINDHYQASSRPFVTLAFRQGLDGAVASSDITHRAGKESENVPFIRRLRAAHEAVLIDANTFLNSCPPHENSPAADRKTMGIVVVWDPNQQISSTDLKEIDKASARFLFAQPEQDAGSQEMLEDAGQNVLRIPAGKGSGQMLDALLDQLGTEGVRSVFVEGSSQLVSAFIAGELAHHVTITLTLTFGGGSDLNSKINKYAEGFSSRLTNVRSMWIDKNLLIRADVEYIKG